MSKQPMQQEGYDFMVAADRNTPFHAQAELTIHYKGRPLKKKFRPDLIVLGDLVVELKAASALAAEHGTQLLNHLKATGKPVGYLVNFGCREKLEWKRFARTRNISVN